MALSLKQKVLNAIREHQESIQYWKDKIAKHEKDKDYQYDLSWYHKYWNQEEAIVRVLKDLLEK